MTRPPYRFALINPNTDSGITARMLETARVCLGHTAVIEGFTALFGRPLLTSEADLRLAAEAVSSFLPKLKEFDGVLVSAFADPGLSHLRASLSMPVVGIGEASMREAASKGERFCVVTTTPDLVFAIDRKAHELGLTEQYAGTEIVDGDPLAVMQDPVRLRQALAKLVYKVQDERDVTSVVVGGGPLTDAAKFLQAEMTIRIVNPVEAATRNLIGIVRAHESAIQDDIRV